MCRASCDPGNLPYRRVRRKVCLHLGQVVRMGRYPARTAAITETTAGLIAPQTIRSPIRNSGGRTRGEAVADLAIAFAAGQYRAGLEVLVDAQVV
ncbi:hypothetical protein Ga0074812_12712 [Parafrankia irregularis]|uniref:Uncharacterized protein n=1 Tax=Parafrankia irregularis TaxID=795642 RepID=A0A0S4QUQ3_9ACTN|nr:hypothetical protein Ga0074812_12712 [Parafrankia irregularis]